MIIRLTICLLLLTIFTLVSSCKKFVEIELPIDKLTSDFVFSDSTAAESTVTGIYVQLIGNSYTSFLNGNVTLYPSLSSGEVINRTTSSIFDAFRLNDLSAVNTLSWNGAFNIIYHCNAVIENMQKSGLSDGQKTRLEGEARFLRALNFFHLVNFYGDVPLAMSTDYATNSLLARTDKDIVYDTIVNDLKMAVKMLPLKNVNNSKARANRWAAEALLSRIYLYRNQFANAVEASSNIINSAYFQIESIANCFLAGSRETILSWTPPPSQIFVVADAYRFVPGSKTVVPGFTIQPALLNTFAFNDQRRLNWIGNNIVNGIIYYYPYKYKTRSVPTGAAKPEYNIVLRLAEQYLIRSEAYAALSQNDLAIDDLNKIRVRAGINLIDKANYTSGNDALLKIIYEERERELFTEWGHRWLDIKRWNQANVIMGAINPGTWQSTDILYPLPQSDILSNPNLRQNDGYN